MEVIKEIFACRDKCGWASVGQNWRRSSQVKERGKRDEFTPGPCVSREMRRGKLHFAIPSLTCELSGVYYYECAIREHRT
jgi:hypothetical protein